MELVIGGFVSAAVEGAVAKAVVFLERNHDMSERTKELLRELEVRLTVVKAISEAADNRLIITNTNLVQWLRRLQAATQEAEDALDEFEVDEASITGKRKVSELIVSSLRSLKSLVVPDNSMGKLKHVVETLTHLCASSATFIELLKMDDSKANQQKVGITGEASSQLPIDVHVFGREEVTEFILKMITGTASSDPTGSSSGVGKIRATMPNILVLPIVGMSGVGKTTLAQVIYNHPKVKEQFQRKAWVYVSEHFSIKRSLQEILSSFNKYKDTCLDGSDSMEATITKLRNKICGGNRFFLVLDNVWFEMCQEWNTLLTALSDDARQCGSVILVTTQSQRVSTSVATVCPIYLKALPWESFWPLFQYHAFWGVEASQQVNHNMLLIGEKIAKKLGGLPLAARIIGNLLRSTFTWDKWRTVAESDWWNFGDGLQGILSYLGVCYQHLSPKQRQCFAFCSIFPRNYLFDKDRVVQMWIAHDFIKSNGFRDGTRLEEVGGQCFDELVDRSLFQPTFVSNKYVMHDLVRGLAIAVSLHQCFLHGESSGGASSPAPPNIRHLALQSGSLEQCQELHKYKNLRTLLLFGRFEDDAFYSLLDSVLRNSPCLRVLDMSYVEAPVMGWPNDTRGQRKLRFLDLSFTRIARLKDLPRNLQVLHLRGYDADHLPQSITKLINLRHLYVDDSALSKIQEIGQLTELQELDSFIARKGLGFTIRELKNMRELTGRLCIRGIENVKSKEEAMEARLMDKKHLGALVIEGRKVPMFALEGLQPHPDIQELAIKFYQDQVFPHWMLQPGNLANLSHASLENCRFLSSLPPLGHLPLLKFLSLGKLPSIKHVDGVSFGGFPSLEQLEFQWVEKWEEWTEPNAAAEAHAHGSSLFLGRLKKLNLESCPLLRQFPRFPYLPVLRELKISKPRSYILELPACLHVLECLTTLKIEYCHNNLVLAANQFKSLENLDLIKCEGICLADSFQCFSNLRSARVEGCPQILRTAAASATVGLGQELCEEQNQQQGANLLIHLRTDDSLMTGDYFRTIGSLPSLRKLLIFDIPNATHFSERQELWFQQLISLECISIVSCYALQHLPSSLKVMPSIKKLELHGLLNLHTLPDNALPPNLQELVISHCALATRVSKDGGDWSKVVHVPYILVDGTVIQNI